MNGTYTPATPIPGTVLVNIGDLMQQWTADKLISTVSKNSLAKDCLLESNVASLLSSEHLTLKVIHPWQFTLNCASNQIFVTDVARYFYFRNTGYLFQMRKESRELCVDHWLSLFILTMK